MLLQVDDYHKSNEILYVLKSIEEVDNSPVSKISLQKLLYLSGALAPIKEIILSILKFQRIQRGPYNKDIQNIVDHLVAYGLVEITEFSLIQSKNSVAHYKITEGGSQAVNKLKCYSKEEEKYWWINCVIRLSIFYSKLEYAPDEKEYNGLDKIVRIVYQDLTFKQVKTNQGFRALIDFEDKDAPTFKLIEFIKNYVSDNQHYFKHNNDRFEAELILTAFFDHLYNNYITEYVYE